MTQGITEDFFDCCDDWSFKLVFDQWWTMRATCVHDSFILSDNSLEDGMQKLLAVTRMSHSL